MKANVSAQGYTSVIMVMNMNRFVHPDDREKFQALRDFCEDIATVFANTASVKSDFSILGWERDEYRLSLTDLSLEGIMQSKQHELLKSLIWHVA